MSCDHCGAEYDDCCRCDISDLRKSIEELYVIVGTLTMNLLSLQKILIKDEEEEVNER